MSDASLNEVLETLQAATAEAPRLEGFSREIVDCFFRPSYGRNLRDPTLETSGRLFASVFTLFAQGEAAGPAQALPSSTLAHITRSTAVVTST